MPDCQRRINFGVTPDDKGNPNACGPLACNIDIEQASNTTCMAAFGQTDLAQSFVAVSANSCGAGLQTTSDSTASLITISLWDNLPNAGGVQLATGTAFGTASGWVDVSWPSVPTTIGQTYYLVFTDDGTGPCVAGDTANPYPGGQVFANPGFNPFPNFDYTFRTSTETGGPIVITTQYQLGHGIVFGTAVDNFNPPAVGILDDAACDPSCRSAGLPAFGPDWWCQFRFADGTLAGVTDFSAELCFIDVPAEAFMIGYNNNRDIVAQAVATSSGTEVVSIAAPPGELIAYVQITKAAAVSVDCLNFPDPQPRIQDCDRRINFGVTLDDSGNPNDCAGGPTVITTQYQGTHGIVFGTAVDNFGAPDVTITTDGACDPDCRSSGPGFNNWWCQFRFVDGTLAGVTDFSAELCSIEAPAGLDIMLGYNNSRQLVAVGTTSGGQTEVVSMAAPPGELIAYVNIVQGRPGVGRLPQLPRPAAAAPRSVPVGLRAAAGWPGQRGRPAPAARRVGRPGSLRLRRQRHGRRDRPAEAARGVGPLPGSVL